MNKVDVLETLADRRNETGIGKAEYARRSAIYAAVAELIEALREIADVTIPGDGVPNEVWINERANRALANIGETK